MSTSIETQDSQSLRALDRGDVKIVLMRQFSDGTSKSIPGMEPIGIAKSFNFNVSTPKSPIQVLSRLKPAGFARDPEDRTFSMSELQTFERLDHLAYTSSSSDPFEIRITVSEITDDEGNPSATSKQKVITLRGVEFESVDFNLDANGSEFVSTMSGRFTGGQITGDVEGTWDPVTGEDLPGGVSLLSF